MAERPTPYSTAVCMLIALHADPLSVIHNPPNHSDTRADKKDIQNHLSRVIHQIVLHATCESQRHSLSNIENMTFMQLLKRVAGPNFQFAHAAKFLMEDMRKATTSIDSLIDLFAAFRWTVSQGVVDGDSSFGIFVRQRCLGFDDLGFDAVVRFWENICYYIEQVDWSDFERENRLDGEAKLEPNHPDMEGTTTWPLSPGQITRSLLCNCRSLDLQNGELSFDEMEVSLQKVLHENPELTLAHFLRFLNCINHGERVEAVESLHRYFDYAMIYQRKERLLSASRGLTDDSNTSQQGNQNMFQQGNINPSLGEILAQASKKSNVVHYIAVILSSLFFQFGNHEMALLSAEESIRVAQQNGDKACFAYALGWLNILMDRDERSEQNQQTRHMSISTTFHHCNSNISGQIPEAWENAVANISSPTSNILGKTSHLSDIATNLLNLAVTHVEPAQAYSRFHTTGAEIWQSVGRMNSALATNELLHTCYSKVLSHSDISSISYKIASSLLYGTQKSDHSEEVSNCRSLISALEKLKSKEQKTSSIEKSNTMNHIEAVITKLQDLQRMNPHIKSYAWYHCVIRLAHEVTNRNCNLSLSQAIEPILYSCVPVTKGYNAEAVVETWSQSCMLLFQASKWDDAVALITNQVIPFCKKNHLRRHECFFLLELARIRLEISTDDPVIALPALLDSLALIEDSSIDSLYATALVLLSSFHLALDDIAQSRAVLEAALPMILENCHIFYQGEAWLVASKCSLREFALDKKNHKYEVNESTFIRRALSEIQNGIDCFEKIDDVKKLRELYYLEAQVYNTIGNILQRDSSTKKFLEMNRKIVASILPSWTSYSILQDLLTT